MNATSLQISQSLLEQEQEIERDRDAILAELGLPETAFVDNTRRIYHPDAPVIGIRRGQTGFHPIFTYLTAAELNSDNGVTAAQREAMLCGSMFGWTTPGANPSMYSRGD